MAQGIKGARGRALADAALRLSQRVHERYPQAVITMLDVPYTDEDLTIEISLPEGYSLHEVNDDLIQVCLEIEDKLGVSILTQVNRYEQPSASCTLSVGDVCKEEICFCL